MRSLLMPVLVLVNISAVLASNVSFKLSAASLDPRGFLTWQIAGNLTGFTSVLSLTALLRHMDLHVAHPLTAGLGFVLVLLVGARIVFHEAISPVQWVGSALVVAGIVLICGGGR